MLCGDKVQVLLLLARINSPFVRANPTLLESLMHLIPFLAFGDHHKMHALVGYFKRYLDWHKFDAEHGEDETVHVDCFCVIADGIEVRTRRHSCHVTSHDLLLTSRRLSGLGVRVVTCHVT